MKKTVLTTAVAAAGLLVSGAYAEERQPSLEEVVVTAQKREASLQDTPIAISAFDRNELARRRINSVLDLGKEVPSLLIAPFSIDRSTTPITIRGIGNVDAQQPTKDGAVGVYIDGIYMGRAQGSNLDLLELERIEVLRGPQGTLYGRNTIGGAISMISAKPKGELGFKQIVSVGNMGYTNFRTTIDTPEVAGFSAKLSYLNSSVDEWVENKAGKGFGDEEKEGARLALQWQATDELTADYVFDWSENDYMPLYYQSRADFPDRLDEVSHETPPAATPSNVEATGHALTLSYQLSPNLELKSISSYRSLDSQADADLSAGFGLSDGVIGFRNEIDQDQVSQEIQLLGNTEDDLITYVAGLYYFNEDGTELAIQRPNLAGTTNYRTTDFENESMALYGQATWHMSDWDITFGLRYTRDEREGERTTVPSYLQSIGEPAFAPVPPSGSADLSYWHLDPSFIINYAWNEDINTYFKVVSGYRSGGMNVRTTDFTSTFDEEELISYELGIKSELWDRRLRLNTALHYSDYDDIQLDFTPDPTNTSAPTTVNAAAAEVTGVEMDVTVVPFSGLEIKAEYAYLDGEYEDDEVINPFNGENIADSIYFPNLPKNAYSLSVRYETAPMRIGVLSASIDYSWTGKHHNATQYRAVDSVDLTNASIELFELPGVLNGLTLRAWARNLTDEEYVLHLIDVQSSLETIADAYGQPRTYGVDLEYTF